jgi:hypothetical protein
VTVIVALPFGGDTFLGCDLQVTIANRREAVRKKWIDGNGWAVGTCGFSLAIDVVERLVTTHDGDPPEPHAFGLAIRQALSDKDFRPSYDDTPAGDWGFGMLMALPGEVWNFDFSLGCRKLEDIGVQGCGGDFARGAYHALEGMLIGGGITPDRVVKIAVEAANRFDVHCSGIWTGVLSRRG